MTVARPFRSSNGLLFSGTAAARPFKKRPCWCRGFVCRWVAPQLSPSPALCYVASASLRNGGEIAPQRKGRGMAENKLKERWKAGKAADNGWLESPPGE